MGTMDVPHCSRCISIPFPSHIVHRMSTVIIAHLRLAPTVVGVLGIALAYALYMFAPDLPGRLADAVPGVYRFLLNKWYFDELYDAVFVRPSRRLARVLWQVGDATVIDGIPNGVAAFTADSSAQVVRIQTGSIAVYAFTMLIGLVLLVGVFLLFR